MCSSVAATRLVQAATANLLSTGWPLRLGVGTGCRRGLLKVAEASFDLKRGVSVGICYLDHHMVGLACYDFLRNRFFVDGSYANIGRERKTAAMLLMGVTPQPEEWGVPTEPNESRAAGSGDPAPRVYRPRGQSDDS